MFEAGMNALSGSAGTRNDLAAVDYFRRPAQNYGPAQVVLGYLYDTGLIVVRDPSQAADWYRKAADAGDPLAQWLLGRLYVMAAGLPRDDAAAQKWLTLSTNQKNPFAAYLLGSLLSEHDYAQAPHWFRMAAEQGLPQAQYSYAWTLKEGRGIDRDRVRLTPGFCLRSKEAILRHRTTLDNWRVCSPVIRSIRPKQMPGKLEDSVSRSIAAHGCTGWEGEFSEIPAPPPPKIQKFCR